jgi:hypothetical protein
LLAGQGRQTALRVVEEQMKGAMASGGRRLSALRAAHDVLRRAVAEVGLLLVDGWAWV